MQAAAAAGIPRRVLVSTGKGEAIKNSLRAAGISVPVSLLPAAGGAAGIPPEIVPITVHTDLRSFVSVLIEHGSLA